MQHDHTKPFTNESLDEKGYKPDQSLVGKTYRHQATGHEYVLMGFIFDTDHDLWKTVYTRSDGEVNDDPVAFCSSLERWNGEKDGKPRFVEVDVKSATDEPDLFDNVQANLNRSA